MEEIKERTCQEGKNMNCKHSNKPLSCLYLRYIYLSFSIFAALRTMTSANTIIVSHCSFCKYVKVGRSLPTTTPGSRIRVSFTPFGFRGGQNRAWVDFSQTSFSFSLPQIWFHYFFTLILFILFHFLSSAPVMLRQAWSAGIFAIQRPSTKGLRHISSLDPALC